MKVAQSCPTLRPHGLFSPWNSPGQNTGVGSLSLLQGIFPTQGTYLRSYKTWVSILTTNWGCGQWQPSTSLSLFPHVEREVMGTSLAVQWLRLHAPNAVHEGSILGWGTKIPHAMHVWLKRKKERERDDGL